jgi:hypothetical protein
VLHDPPAIAASQITATNAPLNTNQNIILQAQSPLAATVVAIGCRPPDGYYHTNQSMGQSLTHHE